MALKFKLKDAYEFGWPGLKGLAYSDRTNFERASCAAFDVDTKHGKVKTTVSDRIYYVLDGKGEFWVDGETFDVEATDVVIIPKNTPYDYKRTGEKLKLFLVHSPSFDPDGDVKLE